MERRPLGCELDGAVARDHAKHAECQPQWQGTIPTGSRNRRRGGALYSPKSNYAPGCPARGSDSEAARGVCRTRRQCMETPRAAPESGWAGHACGAPGAWQFRFMPDGHWKPEATGTGPGPGRTMSLGHSGRMSVWPGPPAAPRLRYSGCQIGACARGTQAGMGRKTSLGHV